MRVLLINSVCGVGSTGRICLALAQSFEAQGDEAKIAFGRNKTVPEDAKRFAVRIGTDLQMKLHGVESRLLDNAGFGSRRATAAFLKWAEAYDPDLLWLHNLHGYYINVEQLFAWIKTRPQMKVKWTLHDCWAFTGHCTHYMAVGCEQWKIGCRRKNSRKPQPIRFRDRKKARFIRRIRIRRPFCPQGHRQVPGTGGKRKAAA